MTYMLRFDDEGSRTGVRDRHESALGSSITASTMSVNHDTPSDGTPANGPTGEDAESFWGSERDWSGQVRRVTGRHERVGSRLRTGNAGGVQRRGDFRRSAPRRCHRADEPERSVFSRLGRHRLRLRQRLRLRLWRRIGTRCASGAQSTDERGSLHRRTCTTLGQRRPRSNHGSPAHQGLCRRASRRAHQSPCGKPRAALTAAAVAERPPAFDDAAEPIASSEPTPTTGDGGGDDGWGDEWAPDTHQVPPPRNGIDPLLAKFGAAAVVLTLLVSFVLTMRNDSVDRVAGGGPVSTLGVLPADAGDRADVDTSAGESGADDQTAAAGDESATAQATGSTTESGSSAETADAAGTTAETESAAETTASEPSAAEDHSD